MPISITKFQKTVWDYYHQHGRDLPWRQPEPDGSFDPYKILVSEVMLQQTQVARVIPKFHAFLQSFPDVHALASVPLAEVLIAWSGLGYNRRAKYLHEAAKYLAAKRTRWGVNDLIACKGIGNNTAAAVVVYAYNQPIAFIETNIRTVYIHHFFKGHTKVSDKEILDIIKLTLISREEQPECSGPPSPGAMRNPEGVSRYREWYWALMDYGTYLKSTVGNAARFTQGKTKQSVFEGSTRQIRGQVIQLLTQGPLAHQEIQELITDKRLVNVLSALQSESLIKLQGTQYSLAN